MPLHPILSTFNWANPHIQDPRVPHQSPKITRNTPWIAAFYQAPLKSGLYDIATALNFYPDLIFHSILSLPHLGRPSCTFSTIRVRYQSPNMTNNTWKLSHFPSAPLKSGWNHVMAVLHSLLEPMCCFIYIQRGHALHVWPQNHHHPHQSPQKTKNTSKRGKFPLNTFEKCLKSCCSVPEFLPRTHLLLLITTS